MNLEKFPLSYSNDFSHTRIKIIVIYGIVKKSNDLASKCPRKTAEKLQNAQADRALIEMLFMNNGQVVTFDIASVRVFDSNANGTLLLYIIGEA